MSVDTKEDPEVLVLELCELVIAVSNKKELLGVISPAMSLARISPMIPFCVLLVAEPVLLVAEPVLIVSESVLLVSELAVS